MRNILLPTIVMLALVFFGFSMGWEFGEGRVDSIKAKHAESIREFERQLSYEALMFELEREQLVKRARGKIRLVEKEIEKPVYRDCVLPDDGMRIHADTVKELNTPAQPRR